MPHIKPPPPPRPPSPPAPPLPPPAAPSSYTCYEPDSQAYRFMDTTDYKFMDAATAPNGHVVFSPWNAECVGVFDAVSRAFRCIDIMSNITCSTSCYHGAKFGGVAAAHNGLMVFAPGTANCVATFDASTDEFRCAVEGNVITDIDTAAEAGGDQISKFHAAVTAPNGLVIFAPFQAACVGVFDPDTNDFKCVDISASLGTSYMGRFPRFDSAAAVASGVVALAPAQAGCYGFFDSTNDNFLCNATMLTEDLDGRGSTTYGFAAAIVAPNGKVVHGPFYHYQGFGLLDADTQTWTHVEIPSEVYRSSFSRDGLVVHPNGLIVSAPFSGNCVGVFDVETETYSCAAELPAQDARFWGAAVAGNGDIIMAPYHINCIGIFTFISASPSPPPSPPPPPRPPRPRHPRRPPRPPAPR